MPKCFLCNKKLGMITRSHMKKYHNITCKEVHIASGRFLGKGNPMYGKSHSLKTRQRLSKYWKGSLVGEKNPFYGKTHTKETREKIRQNHIKSGRFKGEGNPLFGIGHTRKTKKKISKILKDLYLQHPEKHINSVIARDYKKQKNKKGGYISKRQIEIYKLLKKKFPDAQLNYPIKTENNLYFADIGVPSLKLDVEYDGIYWHEESKDRIRDRNINRIGWNVVRIKEEEVKEFDKINLLNHISKLIIMN